MSHPVGPVYEGDFSEGPHTSDEYLSQSPPLGGHVYPPTDNTQSGDSDSFLRGPTDRHNTLANPAHPSRHHHKRERRLALAQSSQQELIKMVLREEHRSTETRRLLHSAIEKLQVNAARLAQADQARDAAEKARRVLEAEQLKRTASFTKGMLDVQREVEKARREASDFQFKMNIAEDRLKRTELQLAQMQHQRDEAMRASQKLQKAMVQLEEEREVMNAQEQGRREGYEEGVRRGRELALEDTHGVPLLGYGPIPAHVKRIKGSAEDGEHPEDGRQRKRRASIKVPTPAPPQPEPLPVPPPEPEPPAEPVLPHSRSASVRTNRTTRTTASSVLAARAEAKYEEAEKRLQDLLNREAMLQSKEREVQEREKEYEAQERERKTREDEMARLIQEDHARIARLQKEMEREKRKMEEKDRERERRREQDRLREEEERSKRAQQEREAAAVAERERERDRQEQLRREKEAQKQERLRRKLEEREYQQKLEEIRAKLEREDRDRRVEQERERTDLQARQRELELELKHKDELDQVRRDGLQRELDAKMDQIKDLEEDMKEQLRTIDDRLAAAASSLVPPPSSSGPATPYHPFGYSTPHTPTSMPLPGSINMPVPTVPNMARPSNYIPMPIPPGPITGMPEPNVPILPVPPPSTLHMPEPVIPSILSPGSNMPQPVVPNILSPGSNMPQPVVPNIVSATIMPQPVVPPPGSLGMGMPEPRVQGASFPTPRVPSYHSTPGSGTVPGPLNMPTPNVPQQFQPPPGYTSRPTSRSTSRTGTDSGGKRGNRKRNSSPDGSNASSVGFGDLKLTSFPIPGHEATNHQPWDTSRMGGYPAAPTTVLNTTGVPAYQPGFVVEPSSKKGKRRAAEIRERGIPMDNQASHTPTQRVGNSAARTSTPGALLHAIPEQSSDEDEDSDEDSEDSDASSDSRSKARRHDKRRSTSGHGHGQSPSTSTVAGLYGPPATQPHQHQHQQHQQPQHQPQHQQQHQQQQQQQRMPRPKSVGWGNAESSGIAGVGSGNFQQQTRPSSSQPSPVIRPQQPGHLSIYGYADPSNRDMRSPRSASTTSLQLAVEPPSRPQSRHEEHLNPMGPGGFLLPSGETSPRHQPIQLPPDNQEPPVIPAMPPTVPDSHLGALPPNFVPQSFTPSGSTVPLPAGGPPVSVAGVGGNPWSASPSGGRTQTLGTTTTAAPSWGSSNTKRSSLYGNSTANTTHTSSQPRTVGSVPSASVNQPVEPFIPPSEDSFETTTKKKKKTKAAAAAPAAPAGRGIFGLWGSGSASNAPAASSSRDTESAESSDHSPTTRMNTHLNSATGVGSARVWDTAGVEGMPGSMSPHRGPITMPVPVPPPMSQTVPIPVPAPQLLMQVPPPTTGTAGAKPKAKKGAARR